MLVQNRKSDLTEFSAEELENLNPALSGHALSNVSDKYIVVSGGKDRDGTVTNAVRRL